jgi:hypothetical protein
MRNRDSCSPYGIALTLTVVITLVSELREGCTRLLPYPQVVAPPRLSLRIGSSCAMPAVFGGQIFVPRQQLLVYRPGDVGQDARPIHNGPLARRGVINRPKNLPDRLRQRYTGRGQRTVVSAVSIF